MRWWITTASAVFSVGCSFDPGTPGEGTLTPRSFSPRVFTPAPIGASELEARAALAAPAGLRTARPVSLVAFGY